MTAGREDQGGFFEYGEYDGTGLAELIRDKSVSCTEVCEAAITRAEKLNPKLYDIVTTLYDYARNSAEKTVPGKVFSGVPFLLKLADYKVPAQVIVRDMLPMTVLGKIHKPILAEETKKEIS